ncbi:putative membrane protein [Rhodoblastus acidophilus]|uniref:DUF2339 domain-containing protein n=1 Tax=Rhodoblastus acidophilus TaxID=1074 RepID=UPI0022247361|nr:DUF2339 domain-containing protein [Rhodoblastus acidophilus]MCW2318145.1 putative membrane protein [Rhodoblastus acidophilus]
MTTIANEGPGMVDDALVFFSATPFLLAALGAIGFFLALNARARLKRLERLAQDLELSQRLLRDALAALSAHSPSAAQQSGDRASVVSDVPPEPAGWSPEPLEAEPARDFGPIAPPPQRPASLEERIGTRWVVYVGGLALALGGLLLARYAVEQGLFGPAMRIACGLALAVALIGFGEKLRRRDRATNAATPTPAVLTAAGTTTAFGVIYAAHALYGFIGPGLAFVALGAAALATLLAALLHGPAIAGLGLIGALGAPLLVHSSHPSPWPLAIYLVLVVGAASALARLRRWGWLALSGTVGAAAWGGVMMQGRPEIVAAPTQLHFAFHTALAVWLYALDRRALFARFALRQTLANVAPALFAVFAGAQFAELATQGGIGALWSICIAAIIGALALAGASRPAVAPGLLLAAGAVVVELLILWPRFTDLTMRPEVGGLAHPALFYTLALAGSGAVAALSGRALWRTENLSRGATTLLASAAALTPLLALWVTREAPLDSGEIATLSAKAMWAGAALALASGFSAFAGALRRRRPQMASDRLALGLMASAGFAALALGLNFALESGALTIALALSALGAAFVASRLDISALRKAVAAMGLVVAARLVWDPRIVGDDLGATPILNWLLFGYGVPAAAFGLAAHLLGRSRQDGATRIAQTLAIAFSALLAFFEIRHAMTGGDMTAARASLSEFGLYAIAGFGFAHALLRLDARGARPVLGWFSRAFAIGATAGSTFGLLIAKNPYLDAVPVEGGVVLNALLLGYALPAATAAALANVAAPPGWLVRMTRLIALALTFAYVTLETRRVFQGAALGWKAEAGSLELYAYSLAWLALGVALLGYGLLRRSLEARIASAGVVLLAVLKVFLYDLGALEGAARAFSFICLGAVLIGIGLVYQKLVFRASGAAPDDGPDRPEA